MNRAKLFLTGIGTTIVGLGMSLVAHAQFIVGNATNTTQSLANEAANNGPYMQSAYNELINFLSSTGGVLFMIVLTILGIVVWLAVKAPRHVVNS